MAITYKKSLKTINVYIHGFEDAPVEVADTATSSAATEAYAEFEKGYKMHLQTEAGQTVVPYHAISKVEVAVAASDNITKADPYCAESGETGETETGETETGETA